MHGDRRTASGARLLVRVFLSGAQLPARFFRRAASSLAPHRYLSARGFPYNASGARASSASLTAPSLLRVAFCACIPMRGVWCTLARRQACGFWPPGARLPEHSFRLAASEPRHVANRFQLAHIIQAFRSGRARDQVRGGGGVAGGGVGAPPAPLRIKLC